MNLEKRNDDRLAGRLLEGKLSYAIIIGLALGLGYLAITEFIAPAFAQIDAAFEALRPAR